MKCTLEDVAVEFPDVKPWIKLQVALGLSTLIKLHKSWIKQFLKYFHLFMR